MNSEKIVKQQLSNHPDTKEIIIREGKANDIVFPEPLVITGNIDAPSRFVQVRKETIMRENSHCLVSKTSGKITLINNETYPFDKETIIGKIETGKLYADLGINNPSKFYAPKELSKRFKLLRSIFPDRAEHATICGMLKDFNAKVNQDLTDKNDLRGNVSLAFEQSVESNVPEAFTIKIPLVEGEDATAIQVDIVVEVGSSRDIKCFLESADAAENIDKVREERVMQEVEKIEDHTTVIFI